MSSKFIDYLRINYHPTSISQANDAISLYEKALAIPFFYQDELDTFFVEPNLTETIIASWSDWIMRSNRAKATLDLTNISEIPIEISIPRVRPLDESIPSVQTIDPVARYKILEKKDWITDPATVIMFDDRLIG